MPDDNLDRLLDSALATYADPGPDSGLEQRVLSALAAERTATPSRRRWLAWAVAIPLAASLLLWIGIEQFRHAPSIQQQPASQGRPSASPHDSQVASGSHPPAQPVLKRDEGGRVSKGRDFSRAVTGLQTRRASALEGRLLISRLENHEPFPKLDVFPSPQPLTAEEQALVAATRASETQRTALVEAAKAPSDVPLAIADLTIPPLVPLDEGKK